MAGIKEGGWMSMGRIAWFMYFSRAIDLSSWKDRRLRLPGARSMRSVFLAENCAAALCTGYSASVMNALSGPEL